MTTSLRSFIKSVRSAKTIADERAIIKRESALIRTSFKDTTISHNSLRISIQKLLYLYILGEQTHFGQIECIKLLASSNFVDKRLGYLATMLILDENQEVLTLLTNSLNNDMNHPNRYVVSLALATLGNIASPELARDLYTDVERILKGNSSYLKKKAALVASKIIEKDPDLSEIFLSFIPDLLESRDHGELLGALKLVRSLYENDPESKSRLIKTIPKILDHLKTLVGKSSHYPDYDVAGLSDPFLQVSCIKTLAIFFTDEDQLSQTGKHLDNLNDILTTVVSYTPFAKNAGAAILHESVKTIFKIPNLDPALKVLGINTLGQLLSTKENNNRYVALNTLLSVVSIEPLAVQRHRQTIVACLQDLDISIKRRALELSFAILDSSNIRILVKEILNFLENPINNDKELKTYIITNVTNILERRELIPNEKWKFDTIVKFIKISGEDFTNVIVSQLLALIMNIPDNDELKAYTVNKIYTIGAKDYSKKGLNLINVYLIGEYGDFLINSKDDEGKTITEKSLVNYLTSLHQSEVEVVSFILTASLKLSTKISDNGLKTQLRNLIESKQSSVDLHIQLKAINYAVLYDEPESIKKGILDRIPAPPIKSKDTISLTNKTKIGHLSAKASTIQAKSSKTEDLLLDLMDDVPTTTSANNNDLLNDIFGSKPDKPVKDDILDLFSNGSSQAKAPTGIQAHISSNIKISFNPKTIANGQAIIETIIENLSSSQADNLQLLIAVPKTQKLTMSSISSSFIGAKEYATQDLKITGPIGGKIKLRVKFTYNLNGPQTETFDFGGFDSTL